jgi:hypothetical protein
MNLDQLIEAIEVEWALASMMPAAFSRLSMDKLHSIATRLRLEKDLGFTPKDLPLEGFFLTNS